MKSERHLRALLRYVDANPVTAKIVHYAEDYPHSSASDFLVGPKPPWLSSVWVENDLANLTRQGLSFRQAYLRAYSGLTADEIFLIEQRMQSKSVYDPLDDLLAAAPAKMRVDSVSCACSFLNAVTLPGRC